MNCRFAPGPKGECGSLDALGCGVELAAGREGRGEAGGDAGRDARGQGVGGGDLWKGFFFLGGKKRRSREVRFEKNERGVGQSTMVFPSSFGFFLSLSLLLSLPLFCPFTLASASAATSASALFEPVERSASHSRTSAVWKARSEGWDEQEGGAAASASAEAFVLVAAAAAAAAPRDARLEAGAVVAMTVAGWGVSL